VVDVFQAFVKAGQALSGPAHIPEKTLARGRGAWLRLRWTDEGVRRYMFRARARCTACSLLSLCLCG